VLLAAGTQSTGPTASPPAHHRVRPETQAVTRPSTTPTTDPVSSAITALATSLAQAGSPGDGALAAALQATADEPAGPDQQASAQQTLSLAGVLLDGGGITSGQYRDVVNVLQPTGATETTTTTVPAPTATAPTQPFPTPFFPGHGHGHGPGGDIGDHG
jgi:hypothetical protein